MRKIIRLDYELHIIFYNQSGDFANNTNNNPHDQCGRLRTSTTVKILLCSYYSIYLKTFNKC